MKIISEREDGKIRKLTIEPRYYMTSFGDGHYDGGDQEILETIEGFTLNDVPLNAPDMSNLIGLKEAWALLTEEGHTSLKTVQGASNEHKDLTKGNLLHIVRTAAMVNSSAKSIGRGLLTRYGRHLDGCMADVSTVYECTCGLSEALDV